MTIVLDTNVLISGIFFSGPNINFSQLARFLLDRPWCLDMIFKRFLE